MNKEIIYRGWIDLFSKCAESKSWVKRQVKKRTWKKKFMILYCLAGNAENPRLGSYDKEESLLCLGEPKKTILLYPLYRINKYYDFKGKQMVLEVTNDKEQWYISSEESMEIVDKWATQILMQSKLSRIISDCIYLVVGGTNDEMKRIGASQEKCILHLNKWGITLALQRCRSILAMWPLKTIRNYECGEYHEFSFEAGRRAPMGEGHYLFYAAVGHHEQMFQKLDRFVVNALHKKASLSTHNGTYNEMSVDIEYNHGYELLRKSAIGIDNHANHGFLHQMPQGRPSEMSDSPEYNYICDQEGTNTIVGNIPTSVCPGNLPVRNNNNSIFKDDTNSKYDKLEHNNKLSRSLSNYDNIDENNICGSHNSSTYDKLNKTETDSLKDVSCTYTPINKNKESIEMMQYHVTECQDKLDQRGNLYHTPKNLEFSTSDHTSTDWYDNASLCQSNLNITENQKSESSSTLHHHSMQEIADHFIYQVPTLLPSTGEDVIDDAEQYDLYTNSDVLS